MKQTHALLNLDNSDPEEKDSVMPNQEFALGSRIFCRGRFALAHATGRSWVHVGLDESRLPAGTRA